METRSAEEQPVRGKYDLPMDKSGKRLSIFGNYFNIYLDYLWAHQKNRMLGLYF
jgi:hypothetical protein